MPDIVQPILNEQVLFHNSDRHPTAKRTYSLLFRIYIYIHTNTFHKIKNDNNKMLLHKGLCLVILCFDGVTSRCLYICSSAKITTSSGLRNDVFKKCLT